ncbi:gfo/Idh/MocA family oxidoreductase [Candidatus Uhrbacteria bacterium]|nr:gfo/Idh/MocA family oxidoreductase [Candidatus Uhrbacteria bacterium]
MKKVKIYGAGSIGNHLAQAARRMGWGVDMVDPDQSALDRMRGSLYPERYGAWDETIGLFTLGQEPKKGYDLIFLGTPPDVRMGLAREALKESPEILLLEKPLCGPWDTNLNGFIDEYTKQSGTIAVMGYDHAVSASADKMCMILETGAIGKILALDVQFRSHWKGIFKAHPWLKGPEDTYLGYWKRGGGASGEHSHALHLWLTFAKAAKFGRPTAGSCFMDMREENGAQYDALSAFTLQTDTGKVGRVVQDVLSLPQKKWALAQGEFGSAEWLCEKSYDLVRVTHDGQPPQEYRFDKTRPDDFFLEMQHLDALMRGEVKPAESPISMDSGLQVMKLLELAHKNRNSSFTL